MYRQPSPAWCGRRRARDLLHHGVQPTCVLASLITGYPGQELLDRRRCPFDLDEHPVHVVAHQAAEAEPGGQRVHERAEADALNDALDPDTGPDAFRHHPSVAG